MTVVKLIGLGLLLAGILGIAYALSAFASNLVFILFWPFLGTRLAPSADEIGSHASWAVISLFVGTPLGYIVARVGWSILSDDS